ncbi:CLUMA_CG021574, isoform A [Clunio marinus]|uniref:CLUMA_CG021574, isoform A n=1 Tax=Clunio marinus TaxID=568069 RepID=A0A1J1J978_9DIPT|nr:CLUMA_CG021574, isoform A [Clunio marinus]
MEETTTKRQKLSSVEYNAEDKSNEMSQPFELQEIHILNLPNEILLYIFNYVNISSRKVVSEVCRKFYELICIVERDCHPLELSFQQIYNEDVRISIINSSREFNELTINHYSQSTSILENIKYVNDVTQKFGARLRKFELVSDGGRVSTLKESQLIKILSSIPNVEVLVLNNIVVKSEQNPDDNIAEFNLHKLKELTIDECYLNSLIIFKRIPKDTLRKLTCYLNSLTIFKRIPKDTLRKLTFTSDPVDQMQFQQFLNQQRNIKKFELFDMTEVKFNHLKLEHLKISQNCLMNIPEVLQQQPKLLHLDSATTLFNDEAFAAMCELKNLEIAKIIIDEVSGNVFQFLRQLVNLKELRLESYCCEEWKNLRELSVMPLNIEKLTLLYCDERIPDEIFIQSSQNLRKLKHIEIVNISIQIINTILQYFPNLESIYFGFGYIYGVPDDELIINEQLNCENLKQFVVVNIDDDLEENSRSLLKLVSLCPNLERIMLSQLCQTVNEDLQQILNDHPKLTHLSLEFTHFQFENETIELIRSTRKRLQLIRLAGLSSLPSRLILEELFEADFPYINDNPSSSIELILKKRNITDWYLNFKDMDSY